MTYVLLCIAIAVILLELAKDVRDWVMNWAVRRMINNMQREFEEKFPDRCSVCSWHHYSITHGLAPENEPLPIHRCKERENHGWRWRRR